MHKLFTEGLRNEPKKHTQIGPIPESWEVVMLYWDIGRGIVEKQQVAGWGEGGVERLAADLRAEFPDMRGFSGRNLRDMRRFHLAYSDGEFWQQAVAKHDRRSLYLQTGEGKKSQIGGLIRVSSLPDWMCAWLVNTSFTVRHRRRHPASIIKQRSTRSSIRR